MEGRATEMTWPMDVPMAHTPNQDGAWHGLVEHLHGVADLAAQFASPFGGEHVAYYAGLWHDLGKFSLGFQRYLAACDADGRPHHSVDHKAAGVRLAMDVFEPIGLLIQGHHGGLRNRAEFRSWYQDKLADPGTEQALDVAHAWMDHLSPDDGRLIESTFDPLSSEMFFRMVFSALVDADWLDTEAHFDPEVSTQRGGSVPLETLQQCFENGRRAYLDALSATPVDGIRDEVYRACLAAADEEPGLFKLTVPTGGGKTLSSMAFALRHAVRHGMRRVVVALPYVSITQQTAAVFRGVFGADSGMVLEHHSGDTGMSESGAQDHRSIWARLASENWDAPIIVTTTVQLLESLFASRPAKTRKIHRLARSVIILDEAQSIPAKLLDPTLDVLSRLVDTYGSTVVLSTATQPSFEAIPSFKDVTATEIVSQYRDHFAVLRRVSYECKTDRPLEWSEVADVMRSEHQCLAIVNTKADALDLIDALDDSDALHLSTLLCGAHRSAVLTEIMRRLDGGKPCRVVSTQVVEAGVDVDFPMVLRAVAPLDSIVQAAGRCNRNGYLETGRVLVFRPATGGLPPGEYRIGTQVAEQFLHAGVDLGDPAVLSAYYESLFGLVDTDKRKIQEKRSKLDYPVVAERYRLIDDDTIDVVVPYGTNAERRRVENWLDSLLRASVAPR